MVHIRIQWQNNPVAGATALAIKLTAHPMHRKEAEALPAWQRCVVVQTKAEGVTASP